MILVDTSVWAESKSKKRTELTTKLTALLTSFAVKGHELVYLELMLGDASEARKQLLSRYALAPYLDSLPTESVVQFVKKHDLAQKGLGAVDCHLLASAHRAGARLWTLDTHLHAAARTLGIAYDAGA